MPARSIAAIFVCSLLATASLSGQPAPIEYSDAYSQCSEASVAADVIAKCEQPAKQGIPGAQYALGARLVERNSGDDMQRGVELLEKAVASGSPPAAYHLATVLVERNKERARELFRFAVCAGYPVALAELSQAGGGRETMGCAPSPEADFTGEWSITLKWDKAAAAMESYRVSIAGGSARVSMEIGGKWTDLGRTFTVNQLDESITVANTNSGWDFDGKWIESWKIELMRTGVDEAKAVYLRTVNNPHLPSRFAWRAFANVAEGTARRIKR